MVTSLTCRRLRPALVDLAVGALHPDDAQPVTAHVTGCAACRDDLAAMRGVSSVLGEPAAPEPDDEFWRAQRRSIMRRIGARSERTRTSARRWKLAGAVATVAIGLVVAHLHVGHHFRAARHSIERLDDDALYHLHDVLPALVPASAPDDAGADLLAVHHLLDDDPDLPSDAGEP